MMKQYLKQLGLSIDCSYFFNFIDYEKINNLTWDWTRKQKKNAENNTRTWKTDFQDFTRNDVLFFTFMHFE